MIEKASAGTSVMKVPLIAKKKGLNATAAVPKAADRAETPGSERSRSKIAARANPAKTRVAHLATINDSPNTRMNGTAQRHWPITGMDGQPS